MALYVISVVKIVFIFDILFSSFMFWFWSESFSLFCNLKTGEKKVSLIYFQSVKLVGGKCFAECKEKNRIISLSFLPYSYIFFLLPLSTCTQCYMKQPQRPPRYEPKCWNWQIAPTLNMFAYSTNIKKPAAVTFTISTPELDSPDTVSLHRGLSAAQDDCDCLKDM